MLAAPKADKPMVIRVIDARFKNCRLVTPISSGSGGLQISGSVGSGTATSPPTLARATERSSSLASSLTVATVNDPASRFRVSRDNWPSPCTSLFRKDVNPTNAAKTTSTGIAMAMIVPLDTALLLRGERCRGVLYPTGR